MPIQIEVFTLLVPIHQAMKNLGWPRTVEILKGSEHDDFLLAYKAMNQPQIQIEIDRWENIGLKPYSGRGKTLKWQDLCVISAVDGLSAKCDWVRFVRESGIAEWVPESDRLKRALSSNG